MDSPLFIIRVDRRAGYESSSDTPLWVSLLENGGASYMNRQGLVLVLVRFTSLGKAPRTPNESWCDEDKHKAPTHPHIRPLSLQRWGGRSVPFPYSIVKNHQDAGDASVPVGMIPTCGC